MSTTDTFANLRVLFADDELFLHQVTVAMLKSIGINEVSAAANGVEAISFISEHDIDLLITDIQMPEMNGIELIQKIRTGKTLEDRELRTIVVTSFSSTEVLSSCLLLDINGFLVKPITPDSAREKIQAAMNEQPALRSIDSYLQVKTDLKVLEATSKQQQDLTAAVDDEPVVASSDDGVLMPIRKLQTGMELMEDLYAVNGVKLLPKGEVLNEVMANRVIDLERVISGDAILVRPA
jgi:YesN/AraC family two-component response regulator